MLLLKLLKPLTEVKIRLAGVSSDSKTFAITTMVRYMSLCCPLAGRAWLWAATAQVSLSPNNTMKEVVRTISHFKDVLK